MFCIPANTDSINSFISLNFSEQFLIIYKKLSNARYITSKKTISILKLINSFGYLDMQLKEEIIRSIYVPKLGCIVSLKSGYSVIIFEKMRNIFDA